MALEDDEDLGSAIRPGLHEETDVDDTSNDDFGDDLTTATTTEETETTGDETTESTTDDTQETADTDDSDDTSTSTETDDSTSDEVDEEQTDTEDQQGGEPRIPKSRFDQVNERRKQAEKKAKELEQQQKASDPQQVSDFDFDAKEKEYMEAVLDGETDKALNIRKEIRAAEQAAQEAKLQEVQSQAKTQTKAELELQETVGELQKEYPVFDAQSESFNQDLTDEALELYESFAQRGYEPADAMRRAVRYTVKVNDLDEKPVTQQQQTQTKKQSKQETKPQSPGKEQVQNKLEKAAQQPPDVSDASTEVENTPDIEAMPENDFDKLSEQEERRLRGDFG